MAVEEITVLCDGPLQQSAGVSRLLAISNINIRAVNVRQHADRTVFRLIVSDPFAGRKILAAKGYEVSLDEVIAVEVPDIPGGFAKVMDILEKNSVAVEYLYSSLEKHKERAVIIMKATDIPRAVSTLEENSMMLVDSF